METPLNYVHMMSDLQGAPRFLADFGVKEVHELHVRIRVANACGTSLLKLCGMDMSLHEIGGLKLVPILLQVESLW